MFWFLCENKGALNEVGFRMNVFVLPSVGLIDSFFFLLCFNLKALLFQMLFRILLPIALLLTQQ